MKLAVQRLEGNQGVLGHLGKWRGFFDTGLKFSTAISEVRRYINSRGSRPDGIQSHPVAKAAIACVNVLYDVSLSLKYRTEAEIGGATVHRSSKLRISTSDKFTSSSRAWTKYAATYSTLKGLPA